MKTRNLLIASMGGLMLSLSVQSYAQGNSVEPFVGMWALTLDYEDENAGWLEVSQKDGYLDSEILWRSGSVYAVDYTMVTEDQLILVHGHDMVRERNEDGNPVRTTHPVLWFQIAKSDVYKLEGQAFFPNRDGIGVEKVGFTGKLIPAYGEAPKVRKIKYGDPINLFNGTDLSSWELINPSTANGWKVVDGVMVNDPVQTKGEKHIKYGNLRTTDTFEDFNLKVEVNIPAGSNGGIYLRGIYEVQVVDSYGKKLDPHNMGALYSRITPLVLAEKPAGEWQEMDITLYQRHLTVVLNGKTLIDNQPVKGVTGGALTSDEFSPGPLYLQGDHGEISYRKLVLTPIIN